MSKWILLIVALVVAAPSAEADSLGRGGRGAAAVAYTPERALADALSEPLQFVGKGKLYGYMSIESCLFRNSKVLVSHGYCTKPEVGAADIYIYSAAAQQVFHAHAEVADTARPISKEDPKSYFPELWYVTLQKLPSNFSRRMGFASYAKFYEKRHRKIPSYCLVSVEFSHCHEGMHEFERDWLPAADAFRAEPARDWQRLLARLQRLAPASEIAAGDDPK